jgi:small-conductance mechanosensitive channel
MIEILGINLFKWIEVILAIIIVILIANIASRILKKILKNTSLSDANKKKTNTILSITIYLAGSILIIAFIAFDILGALISLGILGLGIGFALAGLITKVISGMMIILDKNFKVGTKIKVADFSGKIVKMTFTKTTLETQNGDKINIPNTYLLSYPVLIYKKVGVSG